MSKKKQDFKARGVIDFYIPKIRQNFLHVAFLTVIVTTAIFLLIPFTQLLKTVGKKDSLNVQVDIAPPPPPPPPEPPKKEDEELDEPPPPPPPPPPPQLSLSQLELALDPGIGDSMSAAFGLGGFSTRPDAMAEMKEFFMVSELDEKPRMINFVRPEKPFLLRKDRVSGYTRVRFRVDENGDMLRIERFTETTHPILEDSVRAVFKRWKMTEPRKNGRPVKAIVELPIKF